MDAKIQSFIKDQKTVTICTSVNDMPYCASCYYAYWSDNNAVIFKSNGKTKHIVDAQINDRVAGTIVPDISKIGTVRGAQFIGKFITPEGTYLEEAKQKYYKRHPYALAIPGEIWVIELIEVKMTDNTLGFGKKIVWTKSDITKE